MSPCANDANFANSLRRPSRVSSRDPRIVVVGEELERTRLAALLSHEQQRHVRGEEHAGRSEVTHLRRQAIAVGAVADLVVVLRADDESTRGQRLVGPRKVGDGAELGVVALPLSGQENVKRVVEVVRPLRVVAPFLERPPVAAHRSPRSRAPRG